MNTRDIAIFLGCCAAGGAFGRGIGLHDPIIIVASAMVTLALVVANLPPWQRRADIYTMATNQKGKDIPLGPRADGWYYARSIRGDTDILTLMKDGVMLGSAIAPRATFEELVSMITAVGPLDDDGEKVTLQ